ncbi:hypothetical protein RJ639_008043 [Escallonia herrerae]|uniref:Glycoside hydrolase family 19 catalytic domain-containing protein n=1 Tax=Escallonia herrerae TaxID=1293975 RepID=A0AA88VTX7_9ASTE|nr:hypothetical protein RJ639_008043 [Escallonia herrerae]
MRFSAAALFSFCSLLLLGLGALAQGDVGSLVSESQFNQMLKHRNDANCPAKGFYTYQAFISAAKSFGAFGTTGDTNTRKREIAAFLAQTSHETTGNFSTLDSLQCIEYPNINSVITICCYIDYSTAFMPGKRSVDGQVPRTVHTHGDTASNRKKATHLITVFQIKSGLVLLVKNTMAEVPSKSHSNNYNYGPAGRAIGVDLLKNPDLVASDPTISFKTGLWFWMTPQSPKPSSHDVITGRWRPTSTDSAAGRAPGYGVITNIINGGIECGKGPNAEVADRIGFYQRYCDILKVAYGGNLDCYNQKPFA